ncbi:hypothetical protein F5146DRAFT_1075009 [Armillaria mellea]|nr:hypothetical protein F5146DRAFT_1075009 [Armillaria mellea]
MDDNGPVLLTELPHRIVDTVADDGAIPTLTSVPQASDVMQPRARKHIYETISLGITNKNKIDELAQIHATDPTVLAEYPRTLRVCDGDLADVPIFETIISQMRNLRAVYFSDLDVVGRPFTDSFASPSMARITILELNHVTLTFRAFNSLISSPCLTRLFLAGLKVVEYESEAIAPDVEQGTDFSDPDCRIPQPQSALRCPLKELCLNIYERSDLVIMDLIATARHPIIAGDSLVKVAFSSMYTQDDQVPLFQRFLNCKAIKSAKTLHLGDHKLSNFTEQDSTDYDPLRFHKFETVELRVGIGRKWNRYPPEFQWWANSLRAIPSGSPLKKLRFIITFHEINVRILPDVTMDVWVDLDHALCDDDLELDHLAIDIATSVDVGRQKESVVKRWFFDCLPGTYEKYFAEGTRRKNGSLNVSCRVKF